MGYKANYAEMDRLTRQMLRLGEVLAGNIIGESEDSWQITALQMASVLRSLADQYELASRGDTEACLVFPSVSEMIDQF